MAMSANGDGRGHPRTEEKQAGKVQIMKGAVGTRTGDRALDNPVWAALTGPHIHFAETRGQALRYPTDVSPFAALPGRADATAWADLAGLVGPDALVLLAEPGTPLPGGWTMMTRIGVVQMVDATLRAGPDPEATPLGTDDVADMLNLVSGTQPGPFLPRTLALGTYLGIRRHGTLVAMAGERLRLPGFTEISAVCTDATHRGQGLATRLVRAIAAGIRTRGETPFLHVAATNTTAIRLYRSLGFAPRQEAAFIVARTPTGP
jgi:ribosomal protein S18 acetylase RimI-like enzyme